MDQKDREARLKAQLELQKLNSQERQTDLRVTAELQEAEMREDREIDSNLTELAKLVRESREQE